MSGFYPKGIDCMQPLIVFPGIGDLVKPLRPLKHGEKPDIRPVIETYDCGFVTGFVTTGIALIDFGDFGMVTTDVRNVQVIDLPGPEGWLEAVHDAMISGESHRAPVSRD